MLEEIRIKWNVNRLNKRLSSAQKILIDQIKKDTRQYVPAKTLRLADSAQVRNDNKELVYRTPYARYQYKGYVMTDEQGRTFVGRGEKKPIVTTRRLNYSKLVHPLATSQWFDSSKKRYLTKWVQLVKESIKNG